MPPIGAQGLNLGLRDAWVLAEEILRAPAADPGTPDVLASFARRRRLDRGGGTLFTDSLVRLFSHDSGWLHASRAAGFALFDALPPVKRFLMRRMIYGA